jgi:LmbE family N-acetylglucosaminyl deacetylase
MSVRSHLHWLKEQANRGFERLWSLGFAVTGLVRQSAPARWSSPGGCKVLVVAPHPDDEAIGCVGTILLHIRAGDQVCIAIATDGRRSKAIPDPDEMADQRQREAQLASSRMGIDRLTWLGFHEGGYSPQELAERLRSLLEEVQPDVIYAPSRVDFHLEHVRVAHALALAIAGAGVGVRAPRIRIYQIQVPLTSPLCNLVSDVSPVVQHCESVLAAYTSQRGIMRSVVRLRRYGAVLHGFANHAEEFWEIPATRYCALHEAAPTEWPAAFRAMRSFSLSDPLAYLMGRTERRRLREAAGGIHQVVSLT